MKLKYIYLLIISIYIHTCLYSQFYEYGQDPASIRWKQINTGNFKLIFPEDYKSNAVKVSFLLEESYRKNASQLNYSPRKIPVVIHNQTAISNGFVGIAPRRMELFTYPDPRGFPGEWLNIYQSMNNVMLPRWIN